MCEPISMGIMAGVTIASAGLSAFSQIRQGAYQAEVARMNAKFAGDQARVEALSGATEAETLKLKAGQFAGEQKAQFASAGVDVGSGSALDILADTRLMSDIDAATIKSNAASRAYARENQEMSDLAQANILSLSSKLEAAGTLIGGAAKAVGYGIKGYQAWKLNGGALFPKAAA
jgi:hypothetical protein